MKKHFWLKAAMVAATLTASSAAMAADYTIKLGWVTPDSEVDPYAIGANAFKRLVEERSDGRIEVETYPNRQLGDERQLLEGLRFGTVDAAVVVNAVVSQFEPAFQINDLPFLYGTAEEAYAVLDGRPGEILAEKLRDRGVVVLGYMEGGYRSMVNNVNPVAKPEDVSSVKYRVMQNPVYIDMFSMLGGNAIPMEWGETFMAVQQGTIDGLEMPVALVDAAKFYEVADYLSLTNHTYSVANLLMSERSLSGLPEDLQQIVLEAADEAVTEQRVRQQEVEAETVERLEEKGMEVNQVPDVAPFREAVAPIYEKYRDDIGAELMDEVFAIIESR
ncbi:TRAP transporter substrate-binding protein [Pelagibacterium halotolerans]|uniref:TRAP-type C4-dicarboxylate transport system, periplasmic component n=1 Tax=Pelagibacterium halotolerans (strain DSM 22347 / JCM 15775 / CGMCC 1.7692 / B2) TaxID=1082931 RepID=G4RC59_PELHB|nr:TRAP transporter substrate-binding protein [Pelagibacterium halotolerans]AEQ52682.1 TRAP-type C4-dicarboxylate transport system, periplasmic component [Pelagibacterium halotolerans B2]SEA84364.1 tripartite ATP-independent transporter solute receptor, DctP family [Pelagibacterium halotolerans]